MFYSAEQEKRIQTEQAMMRSGDGVNVSLCQYKNVSCVRCCLPHIGGDSHVEDSEEKRIALSNRGNRAYRLKYSGGYLGPGNIVMRFKNFNPRNDPRIEASQYEDAFPDVGRAEMERRFSERRNLFLAIYDRDRAPQSLSRYMEAAQKREGYKYKPEASSGPASLFLGGSVPGKHRREGELPECQLLGFVDGEGRVGCLSHPLAETSQGYDGRDQAGFFKNTGCCRSIGCEASQEIRFLSASALRIFDRAVRGLSWYEYSRHATSVLVYYLRSYDFIFQMLDKALLLDRLTLAQLVEFTNTVYDAWPMRKPDWSERHPHNEIRIPESPISGMNGDETRSGTELTKGNELLLQDLHHHSGNDSDIMNSLDILSTDIPLAERIMYIALDTRFLKDHFAVQIRKARDHIERHMKSAIKIAS